MFESSESAEERPLVKLAREMPQDAAENTVTALMMPMESFLKNLFMILHLRSTIRLKNEDYYSIRD